MPAAGLQTAAILRRFIWEGSEEEMNIFSLYAKRRKGFSLMEVLVALSILTIVSAVTFGALRVYDVTITMSNTKSHLYAQLNQGLNKMKEELSQSSRPVILVSNPGVVDGTGFTSIDFQIPLPDLDANNDIQWGDGVVAGRTIRYYLGNLTKPNQLIRYVAGVSSSVLANDIEDLRFILSGNSLNIGMRATKQAQRGIVPKLSLISSTDVDFKNQ